MWIICCGMYRSGSTLQYQLVSEMVEKFGIGRRIEWISDADNKSGFEIAYEKYNNEPGIKVFKMHDYHDIVKDVVESGNAKCVYSYRDLRDVFLSSHLKFGNEFSVMVHNKFIENCIDTDKKWTSLKPIIICRYDNLVNKLKHEIARIAQFLGLEISEEYQNDLADLFSLESQKKKIDSFAQSELNVITENIALDPNSLLHKGHINSGEINSWVSRLDLPTILYVEYAGKEWMKEYSFPLLNEIDNNILKQKTIEFGDNILVYFEVFYKAMVAQKKILVLEEGQLIKEAKIDELKSIVDKYKIYQERSENKKKELESEIDDLKSKLTFEKSKFDSIYYSRWWQVGLKLNIFKLK